MNPQMQRIVSQLRGEDDLVRAEKGILRSYPLFCASLESGVLLASLDEPEAASRVNQVHDRIVYGGIGAGKDADIARLVEQVCVPAIWRADFETSAEDVHAESIAQQAAALITAGRKGNLMVDAIDAEMLFAELGRTQGDDHIWITDVSGRRVRRFGLAVRPEFRLCDEKELWFSNFAYHLQDTEEEAMKKFVALGDLWCEKRKIPLEQRLVWDMVFLNREAAAFAAQRKRPYEIEKRTMEHPRGGES